MAKMINDMPTEFKGEQRTWEQLQKILPDNVIVYNHREVNGREFDFCVLVPNVAVFILEVKGWHISHIDKVMPNGKIKLKNREDLENSPKKQSRSYSIALRNVLKDKYSISPLTIGLVCYPFISKKEYYSKGLDAVSEEKFTIFKDDISDIVSFGKKLNQSYLAMKTIPHDELNNKMLFQIRKNFEPLLRKDETIDEIQIEAYSKLYFICECLKEKEVDKYYDLYFQGTKLLIFVTDKETYNIFARVHKERMSERGISIKSDELYFAKEKESFLPMTENFYRSFNLEIYYISNTDLSKQGVEIVNGELSVEDKLLLKRLGKITSFNEKQYILEHEKKDKNIIVSAGAGTGKTYSMVSRISFLCLSDDETISNISKDIAMITFTNEAAENMKQRLKRCFMNYFVLTQRPKYLRFVENMAQMNISTIHKFSKEIIKEASMSMGLGKEFRITSNEYDREKVYEELLNEFIRRKKEDNENYFNNLQIPVYKLRKLLISFSNQLYNKSIDIRKMDAIALGDSIKKIPYFNNLIMEVIIPAELKYEKLIRNNNKIDLKESMILLAESVKSKRISRKSSGLKYLFIDEFQDTDDIQIETFKMLQQKTGYKLFVVGDIKQSIYRFRGAQVGAFKKLSPDKEIWEEKELTRNYRTDKRLLERFNSIFNSMGERIIDGMPYIPYVENIDKLESDLLFDTEKEDLLRVIDYDSKSENGVYNELFEEIAYLKNKLQIKSNEKKLSKNEETIAILVRENWQITDILKEAKKRGVDIETRIGGDLYQLEPALDLYRLVLALTNSREPVYLVNFLLSNYVKAKINVDYLIGYEREEKRKLIISILDDIFESRMNMKWHELIKEIQTKPVLKVIKDITDACQPWNNYSDNYDVQNYYRTNYDLVIEKIIHKCNVDYLTLNRIEKTLHINIVTKQEVKSRSIEHEIGIRVVCTTIHKSKGLEYGTVLIPFTSQRINDYKKSPLDVVYDGKWLGYAVKIAGKKDPNSNYNAQEEVSERVQEESRVLYVALTRAIRNVVWFRDIQVHDGITWRNLLED